MTIVSIEKEFRLKVAGEVRLLQEGSDRYRIFTPFRFEDGDHFAIVMRKEEGGWSLSDEGHTLMRLTYDIDHEDLKRGHRQEIISDALESFAVEERSGELIRRVEGEQFGMALFAFVQTLTKISDVSYLSRERVARAFRQDFRALVSGAVAPERAHFDWADAQRDPNHKYVRTLTAELMEVPGPHLPSRCSMMTTLGMQRLPYISLRNGMSSAAPSGYSTDRRA